jgi:hypothetical protein
VLFILFAVKVNQPEEMLEPRGRSLKRERMLKRARKNSS